MGTGLFWATSWLAVTYGSLFTSLGLTLLIHKVGTVAAAPLGGGSVAEDVCM